VEHHEDDDDAAEQEPVVARGSTRPWPRAEEGNVSGSTLARPFEPFVIPNGSAAFVKTTNAWLKKRVTIAR
jgi:hypothetical protein